MKNYWTQCRYKYRNCVVIRHTPSQEYGVVSTLPTSSKNLEPKIVYISIQVCEAGDSRSGVVCRPSNKRGNIIINFIFFFFFFRKASFALFFENKILFQSYFEKHLFRSIQFLKIDYKTVIRPSLPKNCII